MIDKGILTDTGLTETEKEAQYNARKNLASAQKAYPHALDQKEGKIGRRLGNIDDPQEKLRVLLKLADELYQPLQRFTPCKKGCSSCCRMPDIHVSELEASEIVAKTGSEISPSPRRDHTQEPCPFLNEETCGIYDYRPFFCRTHVVFSRTPTWCAPEKCNQLEISMIRFPNLRQAYMDLPKGEIRDIRQMFAPRRGEAGTH